MPFNPDLHHRRSIRLHNFDYATPGAYFVTIVTQDRECLLGDVVDGEMRQNIAGMMVDYWWRELSKHFQNIRVDAFQIMPNHMHGVVWISDGGGVVGADRRVRPDRCVRPDQNTDLDQIRGRTHRCAPTLIAVVQWLKTITTNMYIQGVKRDHWPPFPGRLWQRNYYEHIIRNDAELDRIRQYILDNPVHWETDDERPRARP